MESYINYLLTKYFIFKTNVELDPGNTIECVKEISHVTDKNIKSDDEFIELTTKILRNFLCFEISVSINLIDRIMEDRAEDIFLHYKKYKCSGVRETETYLNLDYSLNTYKTEWVESIGMKTQFLIEKFGKYVRTGDQDDNHRFEYKFEFIDKGKRWIFSLYDYLNTADQFDDENDIYWHVASNAKKREIVDRFIETLYIENGMCC